jgi:hypothetical protein
MTAMHTYEPGAAITSFKVDFSILAYSTFHQNHIDMLLFNKCMGSSLLLRQTVYE